MNIKKTIALTIVVAGVLLVAAPAKAFYLELPNVLKFWQGAAKAQDSGTIAPAPAPVPAPAPTPVVQPQPQPEAGQPVAEMPPQGDVKVGESNPSPAPMPIPTEPRLGEGGDPRLGEQYNNQPTQGSTCRVNGIELQGSCEQYNNQVNMGQNDMWKQGGGEGGEGGESGDNRDNGDRDQKNQQQNEERQKKDQDRQIKDVKRGVNQVERQLKQFELMVAKFERQGTLVSQDTKTKVSDLKVLIEKYKAITSVEEMQEINMDEMWQIMRDLEEERQNLERTGNVLREIKRIESGVKMFEKQIAKLAKQKVIVPAGITANVEKVKAIIVDIKSGKTENAEDIFDAMQELDQDRGQLEMLARWPQTVKEMDRELKNLAREMKRAKTIVDRLSKKGMDLSEVYDEFGAAVNKMKETRAAAVAKMEAGESEDAFETVQNDFFGQMEDTWQGHKIIMTMSNFGQFNTDFTRGIAQAQRQIKALERKKIDTAGLKDLLAQAKDKGAEVKEMFKAKPIDPDSVMAVLEELEDLRQEFDQLVGGEEEEMPWEKGPQQFQSMQASPTLQKLIPRKETMQQPMNEMQQPAP